MLEETDLLEHYLHRAERLGCVPISRVSEQYPRILKQRLGQEAPGCLWAKGDLSILDTPMVALVGSRDIGTENKAFAAEAGRQAALQGYTLVSGNARGADRAAQSACLKAGGKVISVVADSLAQKTLQSRVLYLSEDDFDEEFSAQRALSRNRIIHCLGEKTFVAQSDLEKGGTWDGTVKNLRHNWSPVFCFDDGSEAISQLSQMGGNLTYMEELTDIKALRNRYSSLFE
jgi:predicted Rossmann fold nucleotide-binding protein DprA/Smf involved in DNA uptake